MMRSISQRGVRRRSNTDLTHAGERRSDALLWSISNTARPPGRSGRPSVSGGFQASARGPRRAQCKSSFGRDGADRRR
eukprot:3888758-Alexandrium_andersonii.AAC.1